MINFINRITNENIISLNTNEIFCFGSNKSGFHGAGSARLALEKFGAVYNQGFGLQGRSYAIPTKDFYIRRTLEINEIKPYVDEFINFAKNKPYLTFLVTKIGCGLAGIPVEEIAPLFTEAINIENIHLPLSFWNVLIINKSETDKIKEALKRS